MEIIKYIISLNRQRNIYRVVDENDTQYLIETVIPINENKYRIIYHWRDKFLFEELEEEHIDTSN